MNAPLNNKEKLSSNEQKQEKKATDIESTAPQSRNSTYDLSKASHPIICFLVVALKAAAFLRYL